MSSEIGVNFLESRGIVVVTLDRAPVNAFTQAMYVDLKMVMQGVRTIAPGARAVVLGSAGKHFCGGNDLEEFVALTPENADERLPKIRAAFDAVRDCELPVVCAVKGAVIGSGVALAAASDLIVASMSARFSVPEVSVGIIGGAGYMARLVPPGLLRKLVYTGATMSAEEVYGYGGVAVLSQLPDPLEDALSTADAIVRNSAIALRLTKEAMNGIEMLGMNAAYAFEQELTKKLLAHGDSKEALRSAMEKRAPKFKSQ